MEVYEISARFMRRIQAKEYEPAEAEVTLKANLAEGEDYASLATSLMGTAKTTVIEAGLKSGKATAEATAEAPKNVGGRPKKTELTPPAAAKAAEPKPEPTPAPVAAPAAEPDEFGEFETAPAAAAEPEKPMAAKELQEWITAHLQSKKIDTTTVKAILAEFGAARTIDTKEEDRVKIKAKVQAALKA
jgi:hypothetical protein